MHKKAIVESTFRAQLNFNKQLIVKTDASNEAIGAIIAQGDEKGKYNDLFIHQTIGQGSINYSATNKELLAVVKSLEHFRHYLIGKPLILKTDHWVLEYLWSTENINSRLLR